MKRAVFTAVLLVVTTRAPVTAQDAGVRLEDRADSVQIWLRAVDLSVAIQALGRYLDRPIMIDPGIDGAIPFFETPQPIHRDQVLSVLDGLVSSQQLELEVDSAFVRVRQAGAPSDEELAEAPEAADADTIPEVPPALELRLFTIPIVHARAADVAAILTSLYGAPGAPQPRAGDPRFLPEEVAAAPQGATLLDPVTIVPDEITNSLLIRSTERDFLLLQDVVRTLDVRPLQVLVEVVIVEARKDRRFSLGIAVELGETSFEGGVTGSAALAGASVGDLVVQVMGLGKQDLSLFLAAARSRGDVSIRSRPTLLASNGLEASILVGTEQPFVQVSRSLPTDEPQRDQVVQYRDVGTSLTVVPTINREGFVTLDLAQEMSQATGETQFDAPVISSRQASTRVTVRDGQTIVIGGLTDRVQDRGRTGIPLLSDIPLIGALFGSTTTRLTETEIFVFITPTIVADDLTIGTETDDRLPENLRSGLTTAQWVQLYFAPPVISVRPTGITLPLTIPEIHR